MSRYHKVLLSDSLPGEFIRYLGAGGLAFIVDFLTLYGLVRQGGFHYLWASTLAFLIGTGVNYLVSVRWVFAVRQMRTGFSEFTLFAMVGAGGVVLNAGLIALGVEGLQVHYLAAKLFAAAGVVLFNFSLRKWLLFSHRSSTLIQSSRLEMGRAPVEP
jgi:putative flippase GtrA